MTASAGNYSGEKINVILKMKRIPTHVTIIMDGNGRWASIRGEERVEGHRAGVESVRASVEFAAENGIKYLSFFAFSEENWKRPEQEVLTLMELMVKAIINEIPEFNKNNIRFIVIGDKSRLPVDLQENIKKAETDTAGNGALTVIVFLSYSGKWDMIQASLQMCKYLSENPEPEDIPTYIRLFESFLSTAGIPDPDLLIRTSGEERISNFMLWQCAYTEFYFTEVLWPDFRKTHFQDAIDAFTQRERRFGRTGEQVRKSSGGNNK